MTSLPLVIFDVDGTLCDTLDVDDRLFCHVASRSVGASVVPSSWQAAPHVTDAGILDWLWQHHRGCSPNPAEVETFILEFEAALADAFKNAPTQFREIPGAGRLVEHLRSSGWTFAFATGGWGRTARLKLSAAGLPPGALLASSDDSPDRSTIFSLAHDRASVHGSGAVVLVGDGVWDVKVAMDLGWSVVGVGRGQQEEVLRRAGATAVVPNFVDCEKVVELLRTSSV